MRRNLVICPIGDSSVHQTWITGDGERTFDLLLIYYGRGDDWAQSDAAHYIRRTGFKFEHMHFASEQLRDVMCNYDCFWLPDDDVALDPTGINEMFALFHEHRLQLAQPAIARGEVTYRSLQQRPGLLLRYTPFVEVMCPLFTREALYRVRHTFLESRSGFGLDLVWPKYFAPREMAILDRIGVHHTRPLQSGEHYQRLAALGIDPIRERDALLDSHGGIDWRQHKRLLKGRQRMEAVRDPKMPVTVWSRLMTRWEHFGKRNAA
jgi:hypothetical protein